MIPPSTSGIVKYVGLDVHAETIAVALAAPSGDAHSYGNIPAHTHALDKLHKRLATDGGEIRYVYEAGPTGFALCRREPMGSSPDIQQFGIHPPRCWHPRGDRCTR
jgi:hypothetical protein